MGYSENEITYEVDIGVIFKNKLRISPAGIDWEGKHWPLDSVTRVRWGRLINPVSGMPTCTYYVTFGNDSHCKSIRIINKATYLNFTDRLWKTVGVRILTEYLGGLRNGKKYRFVTSPLVLGHLYQIEHFFDYATVSDDGIEFEKKAGFLSSGTIIFSKWSKLSISSNEGYFLIGGISAFSYASVDNVHILEAILRLFYKHGCERLSGIFEAEKAEEKKRHAEEEQKRNEYEEQARRQAAEEHARRKAEEALVNREKMQRYFDILELPYTATLYDVKKKYKIMIKLFHPDRHSADDSVEEYASKKTKELNNAFNTLKNSYFHEK